ELDGPDVLVAHSHGRLLHDGRGRADREHALRRDREPPAVVRDLHPHGHGPDRARGLRPLHGNRRRRPRLGCPRHPRAGRCIRAAHVLQVDQGPAGERGRGGPAQGAARRAADPVAGRAHPRRQRLRDDPARPAHRAEDRQLAV
ncbi:MAG: hypothetical protein AVDCRST_MAG47-798, partial [uncultured Nocardioidaceae bacterium]